MEGHWAEQVPSTVGTLSLCSGSHLSLLSLTFPSLSLSQSLSIRLYPPFFSLSFDLIISLDLHLYLHMYAHKMIIYIYIYKIGLPLSNQPAQIAPKDIQPLRPSSARRPCGSQCICPSGFPHSYLPFLNLIFPTEKSPSARHREWNLFTRFRRKSYCFDFEHEY